MIFNPVRYNSIAKSTKEIVTIPTWVGTLTYNGNEQSPSWNNYNTNFMTISGQISGTNAGSYTAIFSLKDKEKSLWADYTTDDKVIVWNIQKKVALIPHITSMPTYTGLPIYPTWNYLSSYFTIDEPENPVNAGEYKTIFTLTSSNYMWENGSFSSVEVGWHILKADPNLSIYPYEVTLTKSSPTATVTATYDGDGTVSTALVSGWRPLGVSTYVSGKTVYCSTNFEEDGLTTRSILVSETQNYYSARYDFSVRVSGSTSSETPTKLPGSISVTPESISLNGYMDSATLTVNRLGSGAITVSGYDSSFIDVYVNGTTITVTSKNVLSSAATNLYITVAETSEYTSATKIVPVYTTNSGGVTTGKQPNTVTLSPQSVTFSGQETKTIQVNRLGNGEITLEHNGADLFNTSISGTTITVTCRFSLGFGSTTLYVHVAETDEYEGATATATLDFDSGGHEEPTPGYFSINPTSISLSGYGNSKTIQVFNSGSGGFSVNIPYEYMSYLGMQMQDYQSNPTVLFTQLANVNATFNVPIVSMPDGATVNLAVTLSST